MVGCNFIMYKICKAALEDSRGIAEVQVDSYRTAYAVFFPKAYIDHFTYDEQEQDWIDLLKKETDDILLVALSTEGQVIGYAFARAEAEIHPGYDSEVLALHVRKTYQRNGIGKALLHKAVEELEQRGSKSVMVWTLKGNPIRKWYESLQGRLISEKSYQVDDWTIDEVAYGWEKISTLRKENPMRAYLLPLISLFEQNADSAQVAPMKAYMRDQFEYLGIKSPQFKLLMKQHIAEHGLPPVDELDSIARELWSLPQREFQYVAISFSERLNEQLPKEFIKTLETMLITKSWWDTVDSIAGSIVGVHFRRFPTAREKYLAKWRKSENFWLRRTCILFQLNYKEETDFPLLCDLIHENLGSKEFFINKAIGWALRQYARTDPKAVKKFVKATDLHPLSRREAMKHLEE